MKKVLLFIAVSVISFNAQADQYVNGYTRSNGTYVEPYVRSSPNSTTLDNYGSRSSSSSYRTEGYPSQGIQPIQPIQPLGIEPIRPLGFDRN